MSETKKVRYAGIGLYGYDTTTKAKPIPFPSGGEGMDPEEVQKQIDKSIEGLPTDEEVQEKIDDAIEQLPPDKYLKSVNYNKDTHEMVYVFVTESGESTVVTEIDTGQELAISALTEASNAQSMAQSAEDTAQSAQTVAANAENTAQSAQDAAQSAQTTAENAQNAAQSAQTLADSAKEIAESALTVANESINVAYNAKAVAEETENKAITAQQTAESAQTEAENAKTIANEANTSATSAQTAANEAVSKADAADVKADEAKTAAQAADTKAVEATEVATSANTKAAEAISKAEEALTAANGADAKADEAKVASQAANESVSGLQDTVNELSESVESAKTMATNAKSASEEASAKADEANSKAESALTNIESINYVLDGFKDDIASANTEISDLRTIFEEHDAECEAQIELLSGLIADEASARESKDAEIVQKADNLAMDVETVSAMATANEANIQSNLGRINNIENNEVLMSGDIQTTIESLQQQVSELLELKKAISQAAPTNGIKVTYHVDTYAEMEDALKVNGIVKMEADIDENKRIVPSTLSSNNTTLNLNGKNLTLGVMDGGATGYGIITRGSMTMTVQGNGVVQNRNTGASESYNYEVFKVDGSSTLNLNGGTYKTNTDQPIAVLNTTGCTCNISGSNTTLIAGTREGGGEEVIFVENGTLNIYNGKFRVDGIAEPQFLLNCRDANYRAGTAKINVYGGKFYGFNPANNTAEGPNTSFIPEGYTATVTETQETIDGVTYTVYTVKTTKNSD